MLIWDNIPTGIIFLFLFCSLEKCYNIFTGLLNEGCMEKLVPCPYCLSREADKESLCQVSLFPLTDCAKMVFSSSADSAIVCDECGSVKLIQIIPDLFLQDMTSLKHLDLETEVFPHFVIFHVTSLVHYSNHLLNTIS